MKILFFGDIVGKSGRAAIAKLLPDLKEEFSADFVIANVENAAHGKGVTPKVVSSLFDTGIDFMTSGNHIFSKPQADEVFREQKNRIIRPANFPANLPGTGYRVFDFEGQKVTIINLNGQVFMEDQFDQGEIDNPFLTLREILKNDEVADSSIRIVDFHAEATSEKRAMGFFGNGKVSLVVGTHTHVQSADAQILDQGTGYITDLGMTGAWNSVIGAEKESIVNRFLTDGEGNFPIKVDESNRYEIGFLFAEIDGKSGKCKNISRELRFID